MPVPMQPCTYAGCDKLTRRVCPFCSRSLCFSHHRRCCTSYDDKRTPASEKGGRDDG